MKEENILNVVKDTQHLLTTIYGDLAQPSVKKVGIALETTLEFCTSIMWPLKLQTEKRRLNFEKRLHDYKKKIENIHDEKVVPINPQLGTPIMDRLGYITNDDIADMFLNLLTTGSSIDTVSAAHPSFVFIIDRLSVDEAKILKFLNGKSSIPYVSYQLKSKQFAGHKEVVTKATTIPRDVSMVFPNNIVSYLENLESLGILSSSDEYLVDETFYAPIYEYSHYEHIKNTFIESIGDNFIDLEKKKSFYKITQFGQNFINACLNSNIGNQHSSTY